MSEIPQIETSRLLLRGHRLTDRAAVAALWQDEAVVRFIGRPSTTEESWSRLLRYVGHWALLGHGFWAIEEKASGRFIGEGGICDFQRDMKWPEGVTTAEAGREIGWILGGPSQGKGFGTEAVTAITAWADRHLKGTRTVCIISPANRPSLRVAEKCGYGPVGTTQYKETDVQVFAR
jgi:RimJ/RimL family protein N-acetyltransferase